jgi:hypothetical protein
LSAIEWKLLDQPAFDRVVEALFLAENRDLPQDAYAVNGRGGDDGIDIHIRRDGRLTILQLKCFPEGFSGGFAATRRAQTRDSFKTALQHKPDEWLLVVPATLTQGERHYVEGLPGRQRPKLTKPDIVVVGQPELDRLASQHPDLVTYFKRDELREAAKDFSAEQALLLSKDDVLTRVAALAKQNDTLHPDWRLEFFTKGDIVGTTLVAKHPHAVERSPVTFTLNTAFGPDHEDLRKSFDRAISFGTPGRIDLPASVVTSFVVDGPEFLADRSENVEITWWAENTNQESVPVSLVFYDDRDKPTASFYGKTTWRNSAANGGSLNVLFHETVTLEFQLPFDTAEQVSMTVKIALSGAAPADVVAGVNLLGRLAEVPAFGIELDGKQLARVLRAEPGGSPFGENRDEILRHRDVAADLVVIQDATHRRFPYPEQVDFEDLVYIRCLRLLLEGKCVVLPGHRQVTPRLNGEDGDHVGQLLSGDYMSLLFDTENYGQSILGHDVYVGHARFYAPQVQAVDPEPALAALDAGTAEGYELTVRTRDDYGFWAFLPERYVDAPDDKRRPVGLGIEGYVDAATSLGRSSLAAKRR